MRLQEAPLILAKWTMGYMFREQSLNNTGGRKRMSKGTKRLAASQVQITECEQGGCLAFAELQDSLLLAFDSLKMGSHDLNR